MPKSVLTKACVVDPKSPGERGWLLGLGAVAAQARVRGTSPGTPFLPNYHSNTKISEDRRWGTLIKALIKVNNTNKTTTMVPHTNLCDAKLMPCLILYPVHLYTVFCILSWDDQEKKFCWLCVQHTFWIKMAKNTGPSLQDNTATPLPPAAYSFTPFIWLRIWAFNLERILFIWFGSSRSSDEGVWMKTAV